MYGRKGKEPWSDFLFFDVMFSAPHYEFSTFIAGAVELITPLTTWYGRH